MSWNYTNTQALCRILPRNWLLGQTHRLAVVKCCCTCISLLITRQRNVLHSLLLQRSRDNFVSRSELSRAQNKNNLSRRNKRSGEVFAVH